ncbi:MAG TPA: hypothetical protein VMS11_12745 [Solirubrobacterales bacterium]|nr:hypothetical protein [Solirubrobacterales bacterium]
MRGLSREQSERIAWALLGLAMCVSAAWLLIEGRGLTFSTDEVYYYARYVAHGFAAAPGSGIEYFLAPHNGHLVVLGKLIYRGLLLAFGSDYTAFRVVNTISVLLCVGLFFVLVRRRVGALAALIPSVLLLFFGYAYETLLWPFNIHTSLSLALGLAAVLALERDDRRGDRLACLFLVLATAAVELGLAFSVGVAVAVLVRPDRWRRAWIFLVPVVLYGIWWLWAAHFDQSEAQLTNVHLIPIDFTNALSAVMGSIFGVNPTGYGVIPQLTTITAWGTALAAAAVVALIVRLRRGPVPVTLWVFLATLLSYWLTIAIGGRPPDSSRYILVGAVLVFLIAADALRGMRLALPALAVAALLALLAIPPNVAKFGDGRQLFVNDAHATRTEYGILELVRDTVDPAYAPAYDPKVTAVGGGVGAPLPAGEYFRAAEEFGGLGYSPSEVEAESLQWREVADTTLVDALAVALEPVGEPADPASCPRSTGGTPANLVAFDLPAGGLVLGASGGRPVSVSLIRFADGGTGVPLGTVEPGSWQRLRVPSDSYDKPWQVAVDGPLYACPAGG